MNSSNPGLLNILLIEDNMSTALDIMATFDRGEDALTFLQTNRPDLAIIDIGLRGPIDGVQVAEEFRDGGIPVIFSTARQDTDTFEKALALEPLAYLVKPFDKLTLCSCLDMAMRLQEKGAISDKDKMDEEELINPEDFFNEYFFIRSKGALHKIKFDAITYIESDRNYSTLFANGRKYVAKISLNNLIHKLPVGKFVRIHQSYIVSFEQIEKININDDTISIANIDLPMGKTYKSILMKRINKI
jgi:two-component system, LytTR family, response regulator LytT